MTAVPRVSAVGGTRTVPAPDPIAADYLLMALRLDQHLPGLIDAYFGPATIKATVDMEALRAPASLRDDAASLAERVTREVPEPERRTWLTAQLVALETQAAVLAGEPIPYEQQVARAFDFVPRRVTEAVLDDAARSVNELLPGDGDLSARIAAWDASLEVPPDRRQAVMDMLLDRFRIRAAELFGLPSGERLSVNYVRNQPWSAYNWYDGGLQSRVDVNTDLPTHLPGLAQTVAHEAYPGHHLEHAWKEADLVERGRRQTIEHVDGTLGATRHLDHDAPRAGATPSLDDLRAVALARGVGIATAVCHEREHGHRRDREADDRREHHERGRQASLRGRLRDSAR